MMRTPSVTTDRADYAPGSTAVFTASNFTAGEKIQFQVISLGADELVGTDDDLVYKAWIVSDVSAADASALAGVTETSWFVTASARYRDLRLVATEDSDNDGVFGSSEDLSESASFSDTAGTINKGCQHSADGDAATGSVPSWNYNILSANKSDYFEGEVIPQVFVFKAPNQAPLTNASSYSCMLTYDGYQANTNAGGFACRPPTT